MGKHTFKRLDIKDYKNKITEEQVKELLTHCNEHDVTPVICAWYEHFDDLIDDYQLHCDYTADETREMYEQNKMIFCEFSNGEIVKIA